MANPNKASSIPADTNSVVPIVAIGASAGGIEALEIFFKQMPLDSGAAFAVIQHLDPKHQSILADLIQRTTEMVVKQVEADMRVEPNHVYVIPPNTRMAVFNGRLRLLPLDEHIKLRLPIDFFFRSLADDLHELAVGIVLSGTGSDGTLGIKEIKGAGGMAMAQDIESAAHQGMPRSAIETGLVDFILPPEKMPEQLMSYIRLTFVNEAKPQAKHEPMMSDALAQILLMIRLQTGHDFSHYKQSTLLRRIQRLMAVNQIEKIADYVRFLQNNGIATEALFRDMLIGVTSFFRDKEVFQQIQEVIPMMFQNRPSSQTLRIWVPGCSSGEEAYTLAMLIQEHMLTVRQTFKVQIFATDIDSQAINTARLGIYPLNIAADVPENYLKHYFIRTDDHYQVTKSLRDMLVFAQHNVIKDPPFSKLDMISCRNLLIYFDSYLQEKVISFFCFALKPAGFLLLGSSESLGKNERDFARIDLHHKIFQRLEGESRFRFATSILPGLGHTQEPYATGRTATMKLPSVRELAETLLLTEWSPPCVIIDLHGHIRYVHGRTGKFLELTSGEVDKLDLVRAAREGLKMPLTTAIYRAIMQQHEIRESGIRIQNENEETLVNLTVKPLPGSHPGDNSLLAVVFEEARLDRSNFTITQLPLEERDAKHLLVQQELNDTREYLQATIEELRSSNEEMQSINEELQSSNEELETSQEELQAVNEELLTVNSELEKKVDELTWANNDLGNILNNIQVGIVLLDDKFQIRRFNPAATNAFHLIPTDIGRLITHVASKLQYDALPEDVQEVFNTLAAKERDLQTKDGQRYILQIRPYRTNLNAIKGVVLTFTEINLSKTGG